MKQEDDGGGEKSFEPTQKKLDDARKRGDIAKSTDITGAAVYLGLVLATFLAGPGAVSAAGAAMLGFLDHPDQMVGQVLGAGGPRDSGIFALAVAGALLPFLLLPGLAAVAALFAQRAFVFAPEKLAPKLSRISPIENAKNKYGSNGLFEFAKSTVKLVTISVTLLLVLWDDLDRVIGIASASPAAQAAMMGELMLRFLIVTTLIMGAIAAIDMMWQTFEHRRKLMMSHKDLRDEAKESEGDPYMKAQRRRKAEEIATNRMLNDVPKADVVIVNPTHYAVALRWERARGTAPVCVAKGKDEIAARIREIAEEHKVPIHSDPPTARALFSVVEIGEEIPPTQYRAVAAAIQFADRMRGLAGQNGAT